MAIKIVFAIFWIFIVAIKIWIPKCPIFIVAIKICSKMLDFYRGDKKWNSQSPDFYRGDKNWNSQSTDFYRGDKNWNSQILDFYRGDKKLIIQILDFYRDDKKKCAAQEENFVVTFNKVVSNVCWWIDGLLKCCCHELWQIQVSQPSILINRGYLIAAGVIKSPPCVACKGSDRGCEQM